MGQHVIPGKGAGIHGIDLALCDFLQDIRHHRGKILSLLIPVIQVFHIENTSTGAALTVDVDPCHLCIILLEHILYTQDEIIRHLLIKLVQKHTLEHILIDHSSIPPIHSSAYRCRPAGSVWFCSLQSPDPHQ